MSDDDFALLPARPADAPALTAIAHAAKRHWGYPEAWIARWTDSLTLTPDYIGRHAVVLARAGETVVGFYALRYDAGAAQLDHLWVLREAMGQGIGRALFAHAESAARDQGANRLWVESDPHAEGFYERMGMVRFGAVTAAMDDQPRILPLLEKQL